MGNGMDKVATGANVIAKICVSLLWLGGGIFCFTVGVWYLGLVAIAYLIYLWVFGGRWLIY